MTDPNVLASPLPPPDGLGAAVQALWWAEQGAWDKAHEHAQRDEGRDAAWVHAHLHRQEGDAENAAYWYARAGKPVATGPLDAERWAIAAVLTSD